MLAGTELRGTAPSPMPSGALPNSAAASDSQPKVLGAVKQEPEVDLFVQRVALQQYSGIRVVGDRALLITQGLILPITGDGVTVDPNLLESAPSAHGTPELFGEYPNNLWALEDDGGERSSSVDLRQLTNEGWVDAESVIEGRSIASTSSWLPGRALVLAYDDERTRWHFKALGHGRAVTLPTLAPRGAADSDCPLGLHPQALAALPRGDVFLAGAACEMNEQGRFEERGLAVQRWAPGKAHGKLEVLPSSDVHSAAINAVYAGFANTVMVVGTYTPRTDSPEIDTLPYLARFDGEHWQQMPGPPVDDVSEIQAAHDGTFWALGDGKLWTTSGRAPDNWKQVPTPHIAGQDEPAQFTSYWVAPDGKVWATLNAAGTYYLVRTGETPLIVPPSEELASLASGLNLWTDYEQCAVPTLVLYELGRRAPADADAPKLRAALRKHSKDLGDMQLVEVPFLSRRYLGLRGSQEVLASAEVLLRGLELRGMEPTLRCFSAPATRTLALDAPNKGARLTDAL